MLTFTKPPTRNIVYPKNKLVDVFPALPNISDQITHSQNRKYTTAK